MAEVRKENEWVAVEVPKNFLWRNFLGLHNWNLGMKFFERFRYCPNLQILGITTIFENLKLMQNS